MKLRSQSWTKAVVLFTAIAVVLLLYHNWYLSDAEYDDDSVYEEADRLERDIAAQEAQSAVAEALEALQRLGAAWQRAEETDQRLRDETRQMIAQLQQRLAEQERLMLQLIEQQEGVA